ncbi:hypothetical protein V7793_11645 [Streptomyces sp. KLMMK]|uniref:Uncharacterized protein n=1 Tax=Streptomyces telluris TaxID=2720021 RepID=A0A9X2RL76_9ACTN|nr:hypothetical protein [Streptomyces telluris]MCQ8769244.1 hypothetical protein [Streptomyces telluris]NJP76590.1 hypothetical protein [Streptomyces telluris]
MSDIIMDATTGFVSAEELVQLAEEPNELAAGAAATGILCATAITGVITTASAALQGGCPTSGCTVRC